MPAGHASGLARRSGWGRRPDPSPGSACSAAIVATRRWKRVSPASSGWNAVAITLPWRTATIRPSSRRARTSTLGPDLVDDRGADEDRRAPGARRGSARRGRSRTSRAGGRRRSARRPRRAAAGPAPRRPRSTCARTIIPAQVPKIGAPERARSRIGSARPQRRIRRRIVVLSPPGRISPWTSTQVLRAGAPRRPRRRSRRASPRARGRRPAAPARRSSPGSSRAPCAPGRRYQPRTARRSPSGIASSAMPRIGRAQPLARPRPGSSGCRSGSSPGRSRSPCGPGPRS